MAFEGRVQGEPFAEQLFARPERRLYQHAGTRALPSRRRERDDLAQLEAFNAEVNRWVAWRDRRGRRAFSIPIGGCSDDAEVTSLDKLTMSEWLDRRGLTSPRLRWLIDYGCRDDYGLTLDQTSAWAGMFYFASASQAGR